MKNSYYTIDDMRRGYDPLGVNGWRARYFLSLEQALEQYRSMPTAAVKSLGVTDGKRVLELVRCHPLFPCDKEGEDVLTTEFRKLPQWCRGPEVTQAVQRCITVLRLRYLMEKDRIVSIPRDEDLSNVHKGIRLITCGSDSICQVYIAGRGLVPPSVLEWPQATLPLIFYYVVQCVREDGTGVLLEVDPWVYEQLLCRAKAWHAKNLQGGKPE